MYVQQKYSVSMRNFIQFNRHVVSLFVSLCNNMLGRMNDSDDYLGFFFPLGIMVHVLNRIFHLFRLNIFASNAVLIISE